MWFGIFKVTFIRVNLVNHKTHKFRRTKQSITQCLKIFSEIENILINIPAIPGPYGKIIKDKFIYVLNKNDGFKTVKTYSEVIAGNLNVNC